MPRYIRKLSGCLLALTLALALSVCAAAGAATLLPDPLTTHIFRRPRL